MTATTTAQVPDWAKAREAIPELTEIERAIAKNLRQASGCGRDWVRRMLDDPSPEAETLLAQLIANSGVRQIRQNEAGLEAQLVATAGVAERYRRALEALISNPHLAPQDYPEALRDILTVALGRTY